MKIQNLKLIGGRSWKQRKKNKQSQMEVEAYNQGKNFSFRSLN